MYAKNRRDEAPTETEDIIQDVDNMNGWTLRRVKTMKWLWPLVMLMANGGVKKKKKKNSRIVFEALKAEEHFESFVPIWNFCQPVKFSVLA